MLGHHAIILSRIKSNVYLNSRSLYKEEHCSLSWKVSAPEKVNVLNSHKRSLYNLLGTWDHLGHEHSENLKVTISEIIFYNSSWQIPAFKLSVELMFWTDSYSDHLKWANVSLNGRPTMGLWFNGWRTHHV